MDRWEAFESKYNELNGILHKDEQTLELLRSAITAGAVSVAMASSIQDVAKALQQKQTVSYMRHIS